MEYQIHITLWLILRSALILAVVYGLLRLVIASVDGWQIQYDTRSKIKGILRGLAALYVPLAILILVVALILWQQQLIGIPALLCTILFYKPLSHFFQGLAIRAKGDLKVGTHIAVQNIVGDIYRWGSTELKLSSSDGLVSIPYGKLYQEGYTIADHAQSSYHFTYVATITTDSRSDIADLIASTPYVKLDTRVVCQRIDEDRMEIKAVPKVEEYATDIMHIISDNGYADVHVRRGQQSTIIQ